MLIDGLRMFDSSKAENFIIASGAELPPGAEGELFLLVTPTEKNLYAYGGGEWLSLVMLNNLNESITQGSMTISTEAPTGVPTDGQEWIVV